jgi:hypothetical protein
VLGSPSHAHSTLISTFTAATAVVTVLGIFFLLGMLLLMLVTFFFILAFSLVVMIGHLLIILFSPLVSGLQLLGVVSDVEEVKVTVLVVSQLEGLGFDPGLTLELISVQELVAEDVLSLVFGNELSLRETAIVEWMWSRCISVRVKQLQNYLVFLQCVLLLLEADEDRLVVVSNVDEGLGCFIPEEHAVFSSLVSLDPKPSRLELKFGVIIKGFGITKIRSSSLSLLGDVESLARD